MEKQSGNKNDNFCWAYVDGEGSEDMQGRLDMGSAACL